MTNVPPIVPPFMGDIHALAADVTSAVEDLKTPKQRSVWSVHGSPQTEDGALGAERGLLLLLPLTATSAKAAAQFADECSADDGREYAGARVDRTSYIGWVTLP